MVVRLRDMFLHKGDNELTDKGEAVSVMVSYFTLANHCCMYAMVSCIANHQWNSTHTRLERLPPNIRYLGKSNRE